MKLYLSLIVRKSCHARRKLMRSKAWTWNASNTNVDESGNEPSFTYRRMWEFTPSSSSFWLLKVVSSSIMCPRDNQHQHRHHSIIVFLKETIMPTVLCKIWQLIFFYHCYIQKQMLLKMAIKYTSNWIIWHYRYYSFVHNLFVHKLFTFCWVTK